MLPVAEMPRMYQAADCFVIATRCEGWCRPLMEAMATGLPTIATGWSGVTAFHNDTVGYRIQYQVVPVSREGGRELPIYAGHQWAEPDVEHLQSLMCHVVLNREEAKAKGRCAQQEIAQKFDRSVVAGQLRAEIAYCREAARRKGPETPGAPGAIRPALLIQCAQGEYVRLLNLTQARHQEVAQAYSIDYCCLFGAQQTERHCEWDKISVLRNALRQGKWETIIYLDADTLLIDKTQDLRGALPEGAWLGLVRSEETGLFTGSLYVRTCAQSKAFFDEVWRAWPGPVEQEASAAIHKVLNFYPSRWKGVQILEEKWHRAVRKGEIQGAIAVTWEGQGSVQDRYRQIEQALQDLAGTSKGFVPSPPTPVPTPPTLPYGINPLPLHPVAPVDFRETLGRPLRIRWEGEQTVLSSLAHVNRELCLRLLARDDIELTLVTSPFPPHRFSEKEADRFAPLFARQGASLSGPRTSPFGTTGRRTGAVRNPAN